MIEIELSTIPDAEIDLQVMQSLLQEFTRQTGVQVRLQTMTWGTAWTEFITIASHGKGPDISHIGGTWVSSLAIMNALRPFSARDIEEMGGERAYLAPTWQGSLLYDDERVWSIPWTGYTFVICYRKDLLEQIGLNGETAFGTIEKLPATVEKLRKSNLEIPWLMPASPAPYSDLVHMAASWIWEAGGDYIHMDPTGPQIVFNSPEALRGLRAWLEVYRGISPAYAGLNQFDTSSLFARGKAAAVVADNRFATSLYFGEGDELVRKNLGVAPVTKVPWYGGGSLVIWRHTQGYPERERAAVQLAGFLTGKAAELRWAKEVHSLPARVDALQELYPVGNPLHPAFTLASEQGRAYPGVPLWRRLEYQIAQGLHQCLQEFRENDSQEIDALLHKHLDPLAERLNLTLKG